MKRIREKIVPNKTYLVILLLVILIAVVLSLPDIYKSVIQPAAKFTGTPGIVETTNGTDHTLRLLNVQPGTYDYYLKCEDTNGNKNQDDFAAKFVVAENKVISQSSSGGGSSGVTYSGGTSISSGTTSQYSFTDISKELGIKEIIIDADSKPKVNIALLNTLPEYVKPIPGNRIVYSEFVIESTVKPKKTKIDIQIPSDWIKNNYIGKIYLLRYSNDNKEWLEYLATDINGVYRVETPGFSVFAIAGEVTQQSVIQPTIETETPIVKNTTEQKKDVIKSEVSSPQATNPYILYILIAAIVGVVLAVVYYIKFVRHNKASKR